MLPPLFNWATAEDIIRINMGTVISLSIIQAFQGCDIKFMIK